MKSEKQIGICRANRQRIEMRKFKTVVRGIMNKKKVLLVLSIVFAILAFCGVGYILYTGGKANAGYACVPMLIELICVGEYRRIK